MKKGYHSVYEKDWYQAIDFATGNGFDFIQFLKENYNPISSRDHMNKTSPFHTRKGDVLLF
jgi:hypothetical protein